MYNVMFVDEINIDQKFPFLVSVLYLYLFLKVWQDDYYSSSKAQFEFNYFFNFLPVISEGLYKVYS